MRRPQMQSHLAAALMALTATGCDLKDPLRPGDVACLDSLMGNRIMTQVPYWRAEQLCKPEGLPDLTGDERLQEMALALHMPFQVQPQLDARLKFVRRWENVQGGSAIQPNYVTYIPKVTVEEHDTEPVGGNHRAADLHAAPASPSAATP